jgi:hypothetical protein
VGAATDQGTGTEWQVGEALGATGCEAARAVNGEKGRRIVMAEEIERLRNGAVTGCETVCPHVRGTVTQYCSLNFTLSGEERDALEFVVETGRVATHDETTLRNLLERTK